MAGIAAFVYGIVCYAIFFGSFLYAIGFLGNFAVPKSIDSGPAGPLGQALLIDALLLALFAIPHSVMARPGFKERWTRIVPWPIERSTYTLVSALLLLLLFWQWQPIPTLVWQVESDVGAAFLLGLFGAGWGLVLVATFLIDHFDLFGLRQMTLYLRGREYTHHPFRTPGLYRVVRHPLYVGWFLAFWCTPAMSVGHLLFATLSSAYILIAIRFEERDLCDALGEDYIDYRRRVPMLIPFTKGSPDERPPAPAGTQPL